MHKIIMIGCGVVGQGFLQILNDTAEHLRTKYDFEAKLVAVSDKMKGSIMAEEGIDIPTFLAHLEAGKPIGEFQAPGAITGLGPIETIKQSSGDMVVEVSFTDLKTGEPATSYLKAALKAGKHVATTNKGPPANFFGELQDVACQNNAILKYEGVVMSGTPIFNLLDNCLAGNDVQEIKGILNGTTNFILTKMENDGMSYTDALKLAQELGYAEADPTADVEGFDALAKVIILGNIVMGANLTMDSVPREGISNISSQDIKGAATNGLRYKLIGSVKKVNGKVEAYVKPVKLPLSDPLAGVAGAMNALTFSTDLSGDVTIQGPGAGKIETGFAILIDLLAIHKESDCCKDDGTQGSNSQNGSCCCN